MHEKRRGAVEFAKVTKHVLIGNFLTLLLWPGTYVVATHSSRPTEALWDCYLPSGPAYQRIAVGVSLPDECVSSFISYFKNIYAPNSVSVTGSFASEGDPFIFSGTYSYRVEYNVTLTLPFLGVTARLPGYAFTTAFSPKPYTIKLAALASTSGSNTVLTSVEPNKTTGLVAYVYNQNGQATSGIKVKLEITEVVLNSGGHRHHDGRPKGALGGGQSAGPNTITGSTGTGGLAFSFTAPSSAGDHKIKATCTDRTCTQQGPDTVWVGIKELISLPNASTYVLLRNRDENHLDNHYMVYGASIKLMQLADLYRRRFPGDPLLHVNDASLERGGLFDIDSNWSYKPNGHELHRRGTEVDIRANPDFNPSTAIPAGKNFEIFEEIVLRIGGGAKIHSPGGPNQHYHVKF